MKVQKQIFSRAIDGIINFIESTMGHCCSAANHISQTKEDSSFDYLDFYTNSTFSFYKGLHWQAEVKA